MPITKVQPDFTVEQKYAAVKNLLYKICHQFQKRYNGDFDALMSTAHVGFMSAVERWIPEKAAFPTYCYWRVKSVLLDELRDKMRHDSRNTPMNGHDFEKRNALDLDRLKVELSSDAARVIDVVVGINKVAVKHRRNAAVEFLLDLGWAAERIIESFAEIREALNS